MNPLKFFPLLLLLAGPSSLDAQPLAWFDDPANPHLIGSGILDPSVLCDSATGFCHLWATNGTVVMDALSDDGRDWYISSDRPPLYRSELGVTFLYAVEVLKVPTGYFLYYTATKSTVDSMFVGIATSADGKRWKKMDLDSPSVIPSKGSWFTRAVGYPKIVKTGSGYLMAFEGWGGNLPGVGVATSQDGVQWTPYAGNPVLAPGPPGSFDVKGNISVALEYAEGRFTLMYTGYDSLMNPSHAIATSLDGFHWTKSGTGPVIVRGLNGAWNGGHIGGGTLRYWQGRYNFWYTAQRELAGPHLMGYAATDTGPWNSVDTGPKRDDPAELNLVQDNPNSMTPAVLIEYRLSTRGHVSVKLCSVFGEEVETLVEGDQAAGRYTLRVNPARLPSGVYFCRLTFGDFTQTRKVTLVR